MTQKHSVLLASVVALSSLTSMAQPVGLWDFNNGDLSGTVGGPLTYLDAATQAGVAFGTTTSFGIPDIGGTPAKVAKIDGFVTPSGIGMPVAADANGGGSTVNQWTIIYDLLSPTTSDGKWRALIETDGRVLEADADLFINPGDGIGISSVYDGKILPNTWYRVAFAVDSTAGVIYKYINGTLVGLQQEGDAPDGGIDGRWTLSAQGMAEIFDDNDGDVAPLYVNSVALWDRTLNAGEIQALGGPSAAGIPQTIPPVPAFLESTTPLQGSSGADFQPDINVTLNPGDSTIDPNSLKLLLDGNPVNATVTPSGADYMFDFQVTDYLAPNALHTVGVVYNENGTLKTNSFSFTVANYQLLTLPTPFFTENFDEVTEGDIPDGWTRTNHTDVVANHDTVDLDDLNSDAYLDWTVVSKDRLTGLKSKIFTQGTIVVNSQPVTLGDGNLLYAESDVRDGNQVQMVFSKDYDFTGKKNVFISFESLYEQNQDNINSFEYSVDGGATWLPGLYLINQYNDVANLPTSQGDVYFLPDGTIDAVTTFNTIQGDTAYGTSYGAYIGAPITQALAPYISGRVNDDESESKRVEVIRLFQADNQSKVRLRFMQAGTGSWYWGIDNVSFYEIPTPVIVFDPAGQTVNYGASPTLKVTASGDATLHYQWFHDGQAVPNSDSATLTLPSVTAASSGNYTVTVTNSLGSATSKAAAVNVLLAPVIQTAPVSVVGSVGSPFTLSVVSGGQAPFTYVWKKGGTTISSATGSSYTVSSATTNDAGSYTVTVSNSSGNVTTSPVDVVITSGVVADQLVVHIKFDGDYTDSSGRGNDATPQGQPTLEAGKFGQSMHFTTLPDGSEIDYASLGSPDDLLFGDSTDFSVSMWVNWTTSQDDLPFLSNKNWNSSGNVGWGVFSQGGGNVRIQATGDAGGTNYSTSATPPIRDGNWHNVVTVFWRHHAISTYIDGTLVVATTDYTAGSWDGGLATNIGQDGTGGYTDGTGVNMTGKIDDVGIWRRLLSPSEVMSIATASGDLSTIGSNTAKPSIATFTLSGGQLHITVSGASGTAKLQKRTSFDASTPWQDVGPLTGNTDIPVGTGNAFYRVVNP